MTPRQKQVLDFVATYIAEHGASPSYREIGAGIGIGFKSQSRVHYLVQRLAQDGHLKMKRGRVRSLQMPADEQVAKFKALPKPDQVLALLLLSDFRRQNTEAA